MRRTHVQKVSMHYFTRFRTMKSSDNGLGMRLPVLETMHSMHDWINALTSVFKLVHQYISAMISKAASYAICPPSLQSASTAMRSLSSFDSSGVNFCSSFLSIPSMFCLTFLGLLYLACSVIISSRLQFLCRWMR